MLHAEIEEVWEVKVPFGEKKFLVMVRKKGLLLLLSLAGWAFPKETATEPIEDQASHYSMIISALLLCPPSSPPIALFS